jgi:hypothetical protein
VFVATLNVQYEYPKPPRLDLRNRSMSKSKRNTMQVFFLLFLVALSSFSSSNAFIFFPKVYTVAQTRQTFFGGTILFDAPPATSAFSEVEEVDIPAILPSDVGMDYVPLATYLATGQLAKADQVSYKMKLFLLT